jgi:hypothetical protein
MEELDDERRLEMEMMMDCNTGMYGEESYLGVSDTAQGGLKVSIQGSQSYLDSGSDLTHGSGVVLAGGMAMAMRQRRKHSPNCTSSSSSSNHLDDSSAIKTLDSALTTSRNDSMHAAIARAGYFGEGDITSLVLMDSDTPALLASSKSPKHVSKKDPRNGNTGMSSSFDLDIHTGGTSGIDDGSWKGNDQSSKFSSRANTPLRKNSSSEVGFPPKSPHVQLNASRPSTSNGLTLSTKNGSAPSAPFKIPHVKSGFGESNDEDDEDAFLRLSRNKKVPTNFEQGSKAVGSVDKKYSSIVHNDTVIRKMGAVDSVSSGRDHIDDNSSVREHFDIDDVEEIAVDHKSRHDMIAQNSSSGRNSSSSSTSSNGSNFSDLSVASFDRPWMIPNNKGSTSGGVPSSQLPTTSQQSIPLGIAQVAKKSYLLSDIVSSYRFNYL